MRGCIIGLVDASSARNSRSLVLRSVITADVPSWLPEDSRFAVQGTSNEIAAVEHTLALMRDSIHPRIWQRMKELDAQQSAISTYATNYPSLLGPTLRWVVHMSMPGVTDETTYLNSFDPAPLSSSAFGREVLTNRMSRLSLLPSVAAIYLIFDESDSCAISRAIPGVDYPGVSYEDEGSTPSRVCLVLRAPKGVRRFDLRVDSLSDSLGALEYKWVVLRGPVWLDGTRGRSNGMRIRLDYSATLRGGPMLVAAFVRKRGGLWGPPAYVTVSTDQLGVFHFDRAGQVESIDYGGFRDYYRFDDKGRIVGYTRVALGSARGQEYSANGEMIVDSYSEDRPRTTRSVKYIKRDGQLLFVESEWSHSYENRPMKISSDRW